MNKRIHVLLAALLFAIATGCAQAAELPKGLHWHTNNSDPIFADPHAQRGGRFRTFMPSFPLTLRLVGPDSNGPFAGYLRANQLSLVDRHPNTLRPIPELATAWAFGEDGKTVYFKLDPDARWSDGEPVTAADYLFTLKFMRSKYIVAPWYNNYYSQVITNVTRYDKYTISVTTKSPKPRDELLLEYTNISPTPRHFYVLDDHFIERYNWKPQPVTGPYVITTIRKGRYIEFSRIDNWWGDDKRYFRHRFNVEHVRIKVIRDLNVAYQYFANAELDAFGLTMPRYWHKKARGAPYENGYIGKIVFYNEVPRVARGMYLNEDDPILSDRNVRLGIAYAMDVQKVIHTVLHNDYERLQTQNDGYGVYTNHNIHARPFNLAKANEYFDRAGWTKRGPDGTRIKNGQRLSVRVIYYNSDDTPQLVVLKEQAQKAGLDLELQLLDSSTAVKQILEKKFQIAWMGWTAGGISPRYWQFYASVNAHKPQTNNITNTDDPSLDAKIKAYRNAASKKTRIALAHQIEKMIYNRGCFIPTYKVPYVREGFWRWLKLPPFYGTRSTEDLFSPFGTPGGLFWIDQAEKKKVLEARRHGDKLPPINIVDKTWQVK